MYELGQKIQVINTVLQAWEKKHVAELFGNVTRLYANAMSIFGDDQHDAYLHIHVSFVRLWENSKPYSK